MVPQVGWQLFGVQPPIFNFKTTPKGKSSKFPISINFTNALRKYLKIAKKFTKRPKT